MTVTTAVSCCLLAFGSEVYKQYKFENEGEKTWVDKVSDDSRNSLDLNIDTTTGLVLGIDNRPVDSAAIFDVVLKACNSKNINTLFVGDCNHTETDKDKVLINSFAKIRDNGFGFAFEVAEINFTKNMGFWGPSYTEATLDDIRKNRQNFIKDTATLVNKVNQVQQAENLYTIFEQAKKTGLGLYFCEQVFPRYSAQYKVEALLDQIYPNEKVDSIMYDNLLTTAQIASRDIAIEIPDQKMVVYRGAGHLSGRADLNEYPKYGNSVSIWNASNISNLVSVIFTPVTKYGYHKSIFEHLNNDAGNNFTALLQVDNLYHRMRPDENIKLDLPNYIIMNSPEGKGPQLYETIAFLKAYSYDKETESLVRCGKGQESLYVELEIDVLLDPMKVQADSAKVSRVR